MERAESGRLRTASGRKQKLAALPDPEHFRKKNANDPGVSEEKFGQAQIRVSNASGYLCHISSEAIIGCPPQMVFRILTNADNTPVFRDIKSQGYRKVLEDKPEGYKVVEVEHSGEVKLLWKRFTFSTSLHLTEDCRDETLVCSFALIKSDVLSKFNGTWTLDSEPAANGSKDGYTRARLEQDILPVGVPPIVARLPVLGSVLRSVCVRAVKRLLEDIDTVIKKTKSGIPLEQVLQPSGGAKTAKPHTNSTTHLQSNGSNGSRKHLENGGGKHSDVSKPSLNPSSSPRKGPDVPSLAAVSSNES